MAAPDSHVYTFAEAGDQQWFADFETRRGKIVDRCGIHGDRLLKSEMVETRRAANRFGRDAEMIAKRAGEGFVRAVVRLQRQREDIRRTIGERARRFAETPRPARNA